MDNLGILLELITIEEDFAKHATERVSKLRALYAKAAKAESTPISHHVGGDVHHHPQERPQQAAQPPKANYPPVNEVCTCGEPVDRINGTSKRSGDPYVMSVCTRGKTRGCGYRKFYDPLPVRDHANDWQPRDEANY